MEPISSKENVAVRPLQKNWFNAKTRFYVKRKKSWFYINKLKQQGKKDARRGIIKFTEEGEIKSPFCNQLVEIANKKITDIWEDCDYDLSDIKSYLDAQQEIYNKRIKELPALEKLYTETISSIKNNISDADSKMNEAVLKSRIDRREQQQTSDIKSKIDLINGEIEEILKSCKVVISDMENREQIALSHEDKVKHDLKEDVSVYVQGTWKTVDTERFDVKPPETTQAPRERHYKMFPRYNFDF